MATTIYTYLPKDELNGSKRVWMDDCMCLCYCIKREDTEFLKESTEELERPALYILLNHSTKKAYIGETDDFYKRIQNHLAKKEFWNEVLVFLGNNNDTLTKTEVQELEYLAYAKAIDAKVYDLTDNNQNPKHPHMSLTQKAKTEKFFKYVEYLSKFVGCHIFEKNSPNHEVSQHMFFCTQGGCYAKGILLEKGFLMYAGSELRKETRASASSGIVKKRQEFIQNYCEVVKGKLISKKDYVFTSPSSAAGVCIGGEANGWIEWKDENGHTLSEVYRQRTVKK